MRYNNKNLELPYDHRLRFVAEENSTFGLAQKASVSSIQYSLDGLNWTELTTNDTVSLNTGQAAYLRGKITGNLSDSDYTQFSMTGKIKCLGNIMYLADYEDVNSTTLLYDWEFCNLFLRCISLTKAPELPATTLTYQSYRNLFSRCYNLTTAPELPATSLAQYCYRYMFFECTSLTKAPTILPAPTLVNTCYYGMFLGCTSLTDSPILPAATLTNTCYYLMFLGCTSLNKITCLATNISAINCTSDWTDGISATGTFVKDPNMTGWTTGTSGIPNDWTVQDYQA